VNGSSPKVDDYVRHVLALAESGDGGQELVGRDEPSPLLVPLLLRVGRADWAPPAHVECAISSRIGDIVTCRASAAAVQALARDGDVLAIEASRPAGPRDCAVSLPFIRADVVHGQASADAAGERGEAALVAVLDSGIDILHEAFLDDSGASRIVAVWDQTDDGAPVEAAPIVDGRRLYGRLHTAEDIRRYVRERAVPRPLGRDLPGGHGTHVASIAAGRHAGDFAGGVAPASKILVVKTALDVDRADPVSIGYSKSHVDALAFVRQVAGELGLPVVVNVSQGMNAGAHDGTSLLERAFDAFSDGGRAPGRVVVKSSGNERAKQGHAQLKLGQEAEDSLVWEGDSVRSSDVLELWFSSRNDYSFKLVAPSGEATPAVSPDSAVLIGHVLRSGNHVDLSYTRFHHDAGDSRLLVAIRGGARGAVVNGRWTLVIVARRVVDAGDIHAWIERTSSTSVEFKTHVSERYTLSIPGTASTVIAVAAVESRRPFHVASFSSYGPTRKEAPKPEVAAPGIAIAAARAGSCTGVSVLSGTSQAAPHVTGTVALALSRRAKQRAAGVAAAQLNAVQLRAMLIATTQGRDAPFSEGIGFGVIDVERFLAAAEVDERLKQLKVP
jgi:subtilisin family serine protease